MIIGYSMLERFLQFHEMSPCRHTTTTDDIPADIQIIATRDLPFQQSFEILVQSDTFDEAGEASVPPEWCPVFHTIEA